MEINKTPLSAQIEQAKTGHQAAYKFLLDSFWGDVYAFQLKRTRNEYDAEEITIQTFSRAFDKLNTYDDKFVFKTWLLTISKNIHIDLVRKKNASISSRTEDESSESIHRIADETPSIEDILINEQHLAQLLSDIKQLKPPYQEVINLRYFQEKTYKEIAAKLDEPLNNVKVKLLRAKKLLSQIIESRRSGNL
ncbi:sigma-70 family RNA polymerase sigma factor [Antarcticibacterium arcticum]|uniref:Sigma-70 family RNA polymerase sigma factor n=1 Tax=Antarcticibacterium arcticum TaxID=2585771 RepID=A0A5B8YE92_9FLAO|nr:sigma-70 family RNA polymerase sigma factor [Antarcticibacterium arcticum]QED36282.1 sigma-70 family RNA polymerase sigma factor [Antarcticibacterium arcticum]